MKEYFMIPFVISVLFLTPRVSEARDQGHTQSLEEVFRASGFTTVEESVKAFEHHFKREVQLPLRVPSLGFTHYFGRYNDLEGTSNDSLGIEFIHETTPSHHYKIDVRPLNNKIRIPQEYIRDTLSLENGVKAVYMKPDENWGVLVFESDNWQYMLSLDQRAMDERLSEALVEIADSL